MLEELIGMMTIMGRWIKQDVLSKEAGSLTGKWHV